MKKVAFYIRVSTEEQAQDDKYGKKNQLEALHALIRSKSATLTFAGDQYIYYDDVSGSTDIRERTAFRKLIEDITYSPEEAKPFDVVAVYKIDRFARKLRVLLEIIDEFERYGIEFISVHESIDTSTPFGKAMLGIIGVISELEIANIRDRMHGGRAMAMKQGKYAGRTPPYGYVKDELGRLKLFKTESIYVQQIFNMFTLEGKSPSQIASFLTDNKIASPEASAFINKKYAGKKLNKKYDVDFWQERTVRRILAEDIYIGDYYYGKTKTINGKQTDIPREKWMVSDYHHESIISKFQFVKAQEKLKMNNQLHSNYGKNKGNIYLLTGLLKCTCCFDSDKDSIKHLQNWIGSRKNIGKGKFTYIYSCRRKSDKKSTIKCNSIPLPAKEIEDYVIEFILELLSNPVDTFNYYKNLESSKLHRVNLENNLKIINKFIKTYESTRKAVLDQNKRGFISLDETERQINELDNSYNRNLDEQKKVSAELTQYEISEGYKQIFETFKENYAHRLDEILNSREETQGLLQLFIKEIVISTRPVNAKDVIAGRKKESQEIPDKILIKLRLPSEIYLDELEKTEKQGKEYLWGSGQMDIIGAGGRT